MNDTCVGGCDKKPWSESVVDVCGVCNGSGMCESGVRKSNGGMVAGIVVAVVAVVAIVASVALYVIIKRKNSGDVSEIHMEEKVAVTAPPR